MKSLAAFITEAMRRGDTKLPTHSIYAEEDGESLSLLAHAPHPDGYEKTLGHMNFFKTFGGWQYDGHEAHSKEVHDSLVDHATRMGVKAKIPEWKPPHQADAADFVMRSTKAA